VSKPKPTWPTRQVLELACAAQRVNGAYVKEQVPVYDSEGKLMYLKQNNKVLMLVTLEPNYWPTNQPDHPGYLKILPEDVAHADVILTYYKRLMFKAIEGGNDFLTTVNSILNSEVVAENMIGYVACLPSVSAKDIMHLKVEKASKRVEEGYIGCPGQVVLDKDCEVLESIKSKNFEGYNICAIMDNKMVGWISKKDLALGACVIIKARIKDHSKHWKHGNPVTRLNYVKAAQ